MFLHKAFLYDFVFFFNDTATTEIYTLSLHDALPIWWVLTEGLAVDPVSGEVHDLTIRSEEHTSELQSHSDLVCRLLLEKKKKILDILGLTKEAGTEGRAAAKNPRRTTGALLGLALAHGRGATGDGMLFFFNDTATTEIYTLSLHDALPI